MPEKSGLGDYSRVEEVQKSVEHRGPGLNSSDSPQVSTAVPSLALFSSGRQVSTEHRPTTDARGNREHRPR